MGFPTPDPNAKSNSTYEPIPADNHIGVCIGVIDMGHHTETFPGDEPRLVHKMKLQFELPNVIRSDGKTSVINSTYNYSLNEKANFRKALDAWLGNDWITKYEGQPYSFLLGLPAMVNVHNGPSTRDPKKVSCWIKSLSKYPTGFPSPNQTKENFWLDLDAKKLPAILSLWDAVEIRKSDEYRAGGFTDEAPKPDQKQQAYQASQNKPSPYSNLPSTASTTGNPATTPPSHIAPLLQQYGLTWPLCVDDLTGKADLIPQAHYHALDAVAVPF